MDNTFDLPLRLGLVGGADAVVDEVLHQEVVERAFEYRAAVSGDLCACAERTENLVTKHRGGLGSCLGRNGRDDKVLEVFDAEHVVGVATRCGDKRSCEVATPPVEETIGRDGVELLVAGVEDGVDPGADRTVLTVLDDVRVETWPPEGEEE